MGANFTPAPPAAITRVLATFNRTQLAGFIAVAIDLIDLADGDADAEDNADDEPDGTDEGDAAWIEFSVRGRHKHDRHGAELMVRNSRGSIAHEDDEEDDAPELDEPDHGIDDLPHDAESQTIPAYGADQSLGPINVNDANRQHLAAELGLVRTATGWRHPN